MENKKPQLEDGYIQIATGKEDNDIIMALVKAGLNSTEYQIVLLVLRKTWGFKKKEDWISLTQFEKYTNKTRASICASIKELVKKNILVKKTIKGVRAIYQFNKNFFEWKELVKKTIPVKKTLLTSKENFTPLVKKTIPTKYNITKYNITKYNNSKQANTSKTINSIITLFKEVNPFYEKIYANKTQRKSLQNIIDKYGEEWTINLIKKLPEIMKIPTSPRITTPYELEKKMGHLKIFLEQEKNKKQKIGIMQL